MWTKSYDVTTQMKALCLYLHVVQLIFKISQNEIWKFGRNLLLAKFGNERVNEGHVSTDFGLKTKVSEIQRKIRTHFSREKKLLRTLSQVYKFGLYRYCKSSFSTDYKTKEEKDILRGLQIFRSLYSYLKNALLFLKKIFPR